MLPLLKNDDGASMVEYGIMIALIALACVVIVGTLGKSVSTKFSSFNTQL